MGYEDEALKRFDDYCLEKRKAIAAISNEEQKSCQEKVLVARSLLHHEADHMVSVYAKYVSMQEDGEKSRSHHPDLGTRRDGRTGVRADSGSKEFWNLQEAMVSVVCAGLEDISFNKWKSNLIDAMGQVQAAEEMERLPRFSKACGKVMDSLDIDFSDIEDELKLIFEPECVYNTLVLLVTAVKSYCEFLDRLCEKQKR